MNLPTWWVPAFRQLGESNVTDDEKDQQQHRYEQDGFSSCHDWSLDNAGSVPLLSRRAK
jgi:hypothetical protein